MRYYNPTDIRSLVVLSCNRCAYTSCGEPLSAPEWKQVNAEMVHIRGMRPGAPRYDKNMSESERTGVLNLVLMCPNHHSVVNSLLPEDHPAEKLLEMKRVLEAQADISQPWAPEEELDRFGRFLMDRSGAVMIDWLSEDDAVEVSEVRTAKTAKETRSPRAKKATTKDG